MIKIGIIGYGYWGPNLVRNFAGAKSCEVKIVVDSKEERLAMLHERYPMIQGHKDCDKLFSDDEINAVVIATPVFTHFDLAKKALLQGKHVLIEKPMTSSVEEAEELIAIAEQKGLTLMVDHTFLYTGAVIKIKEIVKSGELGRLKYFDSSRINLGLFQPDINDLWDLAPHDISILNYIFDEKPISVQASGVSHTGNSIENIAFLTVNFESGMIAHFNCSWTSPVKVRQTLIGGDKKMIVYNDMEPTNKVQVYDYGYEIETTESKNSIIADYRMGDIFIPKVDLTEALGKVVNDFLHSIKTGEVPVSNATLGLDVVKILECSSLSLKNKGIEIKIP